MKQINRERKFALLSNQGTAMHETVLTEWEHVNRPDLLQRAIDAAMVSTDWGGSLEFVEVTDNDAFYEPPSAGPA